MGNLVSMPITKYLGLLPDLAVNLANLYSGAGLSNTVAASHMSLFKGERIKIKANI